MSWKKRHIKVTGENGASTTGNRAVEPEMLELVDGRFIIPMQGFSQSFNISVAAAIALYHGWHQRETRLGRSGDLTSNEQQILLANYYLRCLDNPESIVAQLLE